jgi:hypothetical protein
MGLPMLPLRGIDVSLVRVTLLTANASTGALSTTATIGTITAVLDGAGIRKRMRLAEISAITSPRENNVPIQVGTEIVLREILDRRASVLPTTGPILAKLADTLGDPAGTPYARVEISRGNNTWTYDGIFSEYNEGPYTKEANYGEMTFLPVDNGANNPAYS